MTDCEFPDSSILLVDDEEGLRLTFELFLKRAGYQRVDGVSTMAEALAAVESTTYDLIISDIVLDGASGVDLLRRVREMGRECPVVMVTGYPNIETAAEAVRFRAFDYLPKPVKKDDLLGVTRRALAHEKERQRAERERSAGELSLRMRQTALEVLSDCVLTVDNAGRIIEVNEHACDWLCRNAPEIHRGAVLAETSGELARFLLADVRATLSGHAPVQEHQVECRRNDGCLMVLRLTSTVLQDEAGAARGVVLAVRDVTAGGSLAGVKEQGFHGLVGASPAMQEVYRLITAVGPVDTTVLVSGESGTGKELVAEALHRESLRRERPLVKVDCAAIPEDLLESELFGHRKGAFTGAERDRPGRILQADGGTLFLDEIGDISPRMQLRLLRFLQERVFYPVGRDLPIQVDVRVIAATNADLAQKVRDGQFREDLLFRLRVVDLKLPALRERSDDVPLLAEHFLRRLEARLHKRIVCIGADAMALLSRHLWPGNVRELQHVIERAYVYCADDTITAMDLPAEVLQEAPVSEEEPPSIAGGAPIGEEEAAGADEVERIIQALKRAGGNKAKAARILGMDRTTIYRKISALRIDVSRIAPDDVFSAGSPSSSDD